MKNVIVLFTSLLICIAGLSQTDELNFKKYWKFRNAFRQNFIKIGPFQGDGIPAARRNLGDCIDNVTYGLDGLPEGTLYYGDGMIRQGHYIGFLATEYRLLKDHGQDVTGVLNELYYALNAINRVDLNAEPIITQLPENQMPAAKPESLNGFYLRDDVPENYFEKWQDEQIRCRCNHGSVYSNNNIAKAHGTENYTAKWETTDHSIPSLDQMTSLLVGLAVCDKLLEDGIYVQPTPSDPVMDLRNEVKQITNRIISYPFQHNWFLLDEWGWPVGNGGGELLFTAYPITVIGEKIVGNDYSSNIKRRITKYGIAQAYHCLPTQEDKDEMWDTLNIFEKAQVNNYSNYNPWPLNVGGLSNFEQYQSGPSSHEIPTDYLQSLWNVILPDVWPAMYADWQDNYKFDETMPWPISAIEFEKMNIKDYNNTIMFNLGVASGIFNEAKVSQWGTMTNNYQLVLIDALLNNHTPTGGKTLFQTFLNSMPIYGGFKFGALENWEDPLTDRQLIWPGGWGGEYKWTHSGESNSDAGFEGQFSALDYMYFHNLYYLVYGGTLPDYEESYGCICEGSAFEIQNLPQSTDVNNLLAPLSTYTTNNVAILPALAQKLSLLEFCMNNTFSDFTTNDLSTTHNLKQLFDDYHDIGISLNDYQTQHFTVKNDGELNIESRLVICETKILTVKDGGTVNLDKGEIRVNSGAQLIIEGNVNTAYATKIIVEDNGKIIIRNGGVLNNHGYIQIKDGASLEYEEGATLNLYNNGSEVHFDGGNLIIKEDADFTFGIGGSTSGQLRFSSWGQHIIAEDNTSILLDGNGENDPILVLDKDADFWCSSSGLKWITIFNGKVIFHENSRLVSIPDFNSNDVHYDGIEINRGLVVFDQSVIANSTFNEVPIYAPLFYGATGVFNLINSEINNTTANSVVKIKGMSYNISGCVFNGSAKYLFDGQNTTLFSTITNCDFNGDLSTVGVIDNSIAEIQISNCNFNTLYAGVHKMNGRLNLKCNSFVNFKYAGAVAHSNCILDLSDLSFGGYNTFEKNSPETGTNIALWNAQNIYASFGYNHFDEQGNLPIIQGALNLISAPPPLAPKILLFKFNRWNSANVAPTIGDFNITSSFPSTFGNPIKIVTADHQSASCPSSGGSLPPDVVSMGPEGLTQSTTINTTNFPQTKLYTALNTAVSESNRYNSTKDDRNALALFDEILSYDFGNKNEATTWLIDYGYAYMRLTLQHAFASGNITLEDNTTTFHYSVANYVNVLNALSSERMNSENYQRLFFLEMDKAHLFHMLGRHQTALSILVNMESCGLDSIEQAHVNYWKYEIDQDYRKITFGKEAEFLDTNWVDTTGYIQPTRRPPGTFGSEIRSISSVDFYNCNNPRNTIFTAEENMSTFSLHPNPTTKVVYVTYTLENGKDGQVVISSLEGKQIKIFTCQSGNHYEIIDLGGVNSGVYIYSYFVEGEIVNTGKFVVKH